MGKIGLKIKANMNNVDKLYPSNLEHFNWALKVKCTGCGEEDPNWHLISLDEEIELVKSKANFVYKCKCCARENSLSLIPANKLDLKSTHHKKNVETVYLDSDEDKFKMIFGFDCRGLELTSYEPRDGWTVESGKKIFDDVDLSSKDWCDYNDIDNLPVEISNFEFQFESLK